MKTGQDREGEKRGLVPVHHISMYALCPRPLRRSPAEPPSGEIKVAPNCSTTMITPSVALAGGLRLGNAVRGDRRTHYTDMQAWPPAAPPGEKALGLHANSGGAKWWDRRRRGSLRIYCRICFADALRDDLSACTGLAPV